MSGRTMVFDFVEGASFDATAPIAELVLNRRLQLSTVVLLEQAKLLLAAVLLLDDFERQARAAGVLNDL